MCLMKYILFDSVSTLEYKKIQELSGTSLVLFGCFQVGPQVFLLVRIFGVNRAHWVVFKNNIVITWNKLGKLWRHG